MVAISPTRTPRTPQYGGLRMSADEYLALPDDGFRYELINGVVIVSPTPSFHHQRIAGDLYRQLSAHDLLGRAGVAVYETDVRLSPDLVYRPDIAYYRSAKASKIKGQSHIAPDLIVEILSPRSGPMDLRTKKEDYERFGVGEYLIVNSTNGEATHFVLRDERFVKVLVKRDRIECAVIPGMVIDLAETKRIIAEASSGTHDANGIQIDDE